MIVGKIENGLERGFVKHRLNYLLITDPLCLRKKSKIDWLFRGSNSKPLEAT